MKTKEEQINDLIRRCQKEIDAVPEATPDYFGGGFAGGKAAERQIIYNDIVRKYAAMIEKIESVRAGLI